ncbi:MAG: hypothetical protein ABF289_04905, partial [Clostridiales bacterium]
ERLVDLSISNVPAPNTIAKYIMATRKPPTEKQRQSWKTFHLNHSKDIWAINFFVVPMLHLIFYMFFLLYVINEEKLFILELLLIQIPN